MDSYNARWNDMCEPKHWMIYLKQLGKLQIKESLESLLKIQI